MKKLLLLPVLALALTAVAYVTPNWKKPSVTLAWDYPTNTPISGFRIYYGVEPLRKYTNFVVVSNTNRQVTIDNLVNATTYYYAATAFDIYDLESDYSNEVTNTTPTKATPPGQLRPVPIATGPPSE